MTETSPQQWMTEQRHLGHALCLILDSEGERPARQALLSNQHTDHFCSVYTQTPIAELADAGPFIFVIDDPYNEHLSALLKAPERNWGWLASIAPQAGMPELARHWRARLLVGAHPHQALYRFHDNRVLTRALDHLAEDAIPGYLGPVISACYWQGGYWAVRSNPSPGSHPLPENPAWWHVPVKGKPAARIREANAHRYLLAAHLEAYARIAEQQDPRHWLTTQLALAEAWGWHAPEHVQLLLVEASKQPSGALPGHWQPLSDEKAEAHFKRVYDEVRFWQGGTPDVIRP